MKYSFLLKSSSVVNNLGLGPTLPPPPPPVKKKNDWSICNFENKSNINRKKTNSREVLTVWT